MTGVLYIIPYLFDADTKLIHMMRLILRTKPNSLQLYTVFWQGYDLGFDVGIVLIWVGFRLGLGWKLPNLIWEHWSCDVN